MKNQTQMKNKASLWYHLNPEEKIGKCPFQKNNLAFCPTSQTN